MDTTARSDPWQVTRPLLHVPNSRNPNLVPVGDGFGFLFVYYRTGYTLSDEEAMAVNC